MIPKLILRSKSALPRSLLCLPIPALTSGALVLLGLPGCDVGPGQLAQSSRAASEAKTATATHALVGKDGDFTVTAAKTILNQYSAITTNVAAGASTVNVSNIAHLTSPHFGPLEAGDLVMLYQAQGASIDTTDTNAYGNVTDINNAGHYELVRVTAIAGSTLTLDVSCGGVKHAYTAAGRAQVVRVPQLSSLTVNSNASVVGGPWDGLRGGVVALHVTGATTLVGTGAIDASGIGFRGGAADTATSANGIATFRGTVAEDGAERARESRDSKRLTMRSTGDTVAVLRPMAAAAEMRTMPAVVEAPMARRSWVSPNGTVRATWIPIRIGSWRGSSIPITSPMAMRSRHRSAQVAGDIRIRAATAMRSVKGQAMLHGQVTGVIRWEVSAADRSTTIPPLAAFSWAEVAGLATAMAEVLALADEVAVWCW
ncbi:MAG: hypothetical protein IPM54_01240 [Polyangiaceae bacterium]|nr:hypothetical protein [Polyangiaceae bacterium]